MLFKSDKERERWKERRAQEGRERVERKRIFKYNRIFFYKYKLDKIWFSSSRYRFITIIVRVQLRYN